MPRVKRTEPDVIARCSICGVREYVDPQVLRNRKRCEDCQVMGYTKRSNPYRPEGLPILTDQKVRLLEKYARHRAKKNSEKDVTISATN